MKKYLVLTGILLSTLANAQNSNPPAGKRQSKDLDYYMLKNDKVIHYLATGEVETILTNATLLNGTVITSSGEIVAKNGTRTKLASGDCVNADGTKEDCASLDSLVKIKTKAKN